MQLTPEQEARLAIDQALEKAGWILQDRSAANVRAGRGVAVREFQLQRGYGAADYLLFVDGKAAGVIEAKKQGVTLTGVELQAERYSEGLPQLVPAYTRPLPFLYQSTGIETRFTNRLDPSPRSRAVFHFHRPETLADWATNPSTLRSRIELMAQLEGGNLWPAQRKAVENLELSLKQDRPRALIQMATGSGKTFTAVTSAYRLIKLADARRVLFLVDRGNLGRQALKEFQQYVSPDDGRHFHELYNVQHLTSNRVDSVSRVVITTIQRLYSMLQGKELAPEAEEGSQYDTAAAPLAEPVPVGYNARIPIEYFDVIFINECHRSIYSLWRQVLEYFDAYLIGLTATPSKQTFGFFKKNLVMEYNHEQAVADGVNVDFDVYRIRTRISEQGSTVEAGPYEVIGRRDRETRAFRWERLDDDLSYDAAALDRQVVAQDQIRTVIRTFKERLFTEIFPGRKDVPKTLIYAKDDSHADDIVQIVREEFGRGNDFCEKITYRTTGDTPENLISSFRNSYNPRIVVTVDMIATGTDIKPLEVVMFMRAVKSRNFFEQMKGRGVRVINDTDFQSVTPDAKKKTHFVIVDCVGVCEQKLSETYPLERRRSVPLEKLLNVVGYGNTDAEVLSSVASRLIRLDQRLGQSERNALAELAGGATIKSIAAGIIEALDTDGQIAEARRMFELPDELEPTAEQIDRAAARMLERAAEPLVINPELRKRVVEVKRSFEQTIDHVSQDEVISAGFAQEESERARGVIESFKKFIEENKDEITALQVLYSRPYARRLQREEVKALVDVIKLPPRTWTPDALWKAYEALDRSKVRGASSARLMTDIVSLVRYALEQDQELVPYKDRVDELFQAWLAQQENDGPRFTAEQREWLYLIRDHIAANLQIEMDDLDYVPFNQRGGAGRAYQVFGEELYAIIDELNEVLAA